MVGSIFVCYLIVTILSDEARRRLLGHIWKEDHEWAEASDFHPPTIITWSIRKQWHFSRAIRRKDARLMRTERNRRLFWMAYVGEVTAIPFMVGVLLWILFGPKG